MPRTSSLTRQQGQRHLGLGIIGEDEDASHDLQQITSSSSCCSSPAGRVMERQRVRRGSSSRLPLGLWPVELIEKSTLPYNDDDDCKSMSSNMTGFPSLVSINPESVVADARSTASSSDRTHSRSQGSSSGLGKYGSMMSSTSSSYADYEDALSIASSVVSELTLRTKVRALLRQGLEETNNVAAAETLECLEPVVSAKDEALVRQESERAKWGSSCSSSPAAVLPPVVPASSPSSQPLRRTASSSSKQRVVVPACRSFEGDRNDPAEPPGATASPVSTFRHTLVRGPACRSFEGDRNDPAEPPGATASPVSSFRHTLVVIERQHALGSRNADIAPSFLPHSSPRAAGAPAGAAAAAAGGGSSSMLRRMKSDTIPRLPPSRARMLKRVTSDKLPEIPRRKNDQSTAAAGEQADDDTTTTSSNTSGGMFPAYQYYSYQSPRGGKSYSHSFTAPGGGAFDQIPSPPQRQGSFGGRGPAARPRQRQK